jgi:CheY-like chemotaxis protein
MQVKGMLCGMTHELKRILFVEDDSDIQMVARLALEAVGGYNVQVCNNGNEALEVAPSYAADLILLDVMMPGLDGPDTLRVLRTMPAVAATPILFMTARIQPGEIAEYQQLGAIDVIAKPFDPMLLAATIQEIWTKYHERQCS